MTRPTVDAWALGIAAAVATRAECVRRQVGAVILDPRGRVVATGYNGAPAGERSCLDGACPRAASGAVAGRGYAESGCSAIHAEANAIIYAGRDVVGCTIYVTDAPCVLCAPLIRAAGIVRVVTPGGGQEAVARG